MEDNYMTVDLSSLAITLTSRHNRAVSEGVLPGSILTENDLANAHRAASKLYWPEVWQTLDPDVQQKLRAFVYRYQPRST